MARADRRIEAEAIYARWTASFEGIIPSRNQPDGTMFFLDEVSHFD
jgi:hypothetical protein